MNLEGTIKAIYIAPEEGAPMQAVTSVRALAQQGLEGDRYTKKAGRWQNKGRALDKIRDVTLIRAKDIASTDFSESETRRNLVIETDFDLLTLIGQEVKLGEVRLKVTEDCTPCKIPSQLSGKRGFMQKFKNVGGIRAEVLNDGLIRVGDTFHWSGTVDSNV